MSKDSVADKSSTILTYHRIAEAFKFAYAKRSQLGDEDYVDVIEVRLHHRISRNCAKLFLSERRQIFTKFDNSGTAKRIKLCDVHCYFPSHLIRINALPR